MNNDLYECVTVRLLTKHEVCPHHCAYANVGGENQPCYALLFWDICVLHIYILKYLASTIAPLHLTVYTYYSMLLSIISTAATTIYADPINVDASMKGRISLLKLM